VPLVSGDRVIDPHLEPFRVLPAESSSPGTTPRFLQTSVEFGMKRLVAAGADAIYQLSHVFRAGEQGARHNPEFTMLEWYQVQTTHLDQMRVTEDLVERLFAEAGQTLPRPFAVRSYQQIFLDEVGLDPHRATAADLVETARRRGVVAPDSLAEQDRDGWLNLLLATLVEPALGRERPEFVIDYPTSQAALARIRPGAVPVAERFELYLRGVELCNGYHELTDPGELRERMATESQRRQAEGLPALPPDSRLLQVMEQGLPDCAGNALGFDRVVWLASGMPSLADVLPFDWDRA